MKKFLSLLMMTLLCVGAWAGEVTINLTAQGYNNAGDVTTVSQDGITMTFAGGTNANNSPKYYTSGSAVRMYTGNTLTITAADNITAISITGGTFTGTFDCGSVNADKNGWTGSAKSIVYTCGDSQTRISTITITTEAEMPAEFGIKVTPNPDGKVFNAPVPVTIELLNATEDAMFDYYLDDVKQDSYPEGGFTLYKTTAVKVVAMNGDDDLTEAEWNGTYTIELPALTANVTPAPGTYTEAQNVTISVEGETFGDIDWLWEFTLAGDTDAADEGEGATALVEESGTIHFCGIEANTGREIDETYAYTIDPSYQPPAPTNKYQRVTGTDNLEADAQYIILTTELDAAMGALNNNNKGAKATGYTLNDEGDIATLTDDTDVMVLTLGKTNNGDWTMTMPTGNYINITGNNTNIASSQGATTMTIAIADDAVATIKGYNNNNRQILFQYGTANVFGNYATSNATSNATGTTYSTIYLYKQILESPQPEDKPIVITFDPNGGEFDEAVNVKINVENLPEGAVLKYSQVDADEDFINMDVVYTEAGVDVTESGYILAVVYDAQGNYLADEFSEDFTINIPEPIEYTITLTPAPGTYTESQTVMVAVTPELPEGAKIVYTFVAAEANNAPRKIEGEVAELDYQESGIVVEESGLLTIIVRDVTGAELASYEGEYIINKAPTGIEALTAGKPVAGIRYYNVAGVESRELQQGVNIVVVTYSDGTQAVAKVVR